MLRSFSSTNSESPGARTASLPSTVRVGGSDKAELLRALHQHDVQLNPAAEALFRDQRFAPGREARDIQVETRSVAELGFAAGATYEQLTARARESGLGECPLELGPHLRVCFLDQVEAAPDSPAVPNTAPPGSITVASAPLDATDETPKGFYLRRFDGVLWLRGYRSWAGHIWRPRDVFVFALVRS